MYPILKKPFTPSTRPIKANYFRSIVLENTELSISEKNNCCKMCDGSVILLEYICQQGNEIYFLGWKFENKNNYFTVPCNSLSLDICVTSNLSTDLKQYLIQDYDSKLMRLPLSNNSFLIIPLLHT